MQERHQDWSERFGPLGLSVVELSGDSDAEARDLEGADLVCTTPEKFGALWWQGLAGRRMCARVQQLLCADPGLRSLAGQMQACTWDRVPAC